MKKRLIAMMLCFVMLFTLLPCATFAAGTPLSFVAIDDRLAADLINSTIYYNGMIYVPSRMLKNYFLGITYSYFQSNTTACLESADKMMFFNVTTGKTFDYEGYQYSVPAILQGSSVYLPLRFICSYFGTFSYAEIGGNEYGTVLRVSTRTSILTNEEFLQAAKPAMMRYYEQYNPEPEVPVTPGETPPTETPGQGSTDPEPAGQDTNTGPDSQSPITEREPEETNHKGDTVRFGLVGMPQAETLDMLQQLNAKASFFLSAEEIRNDADMVRQIACRGFGLGVFCEEGTSAEYREAAELLWEAARVRTDMAVLPEGAEPISDAVCWYKTKNGGTDGGRIAETYAATAALDVVKGSTVLLFSCDPDNSTSLNMLLYYLRDQQFAVKLLRETDGK